MSERIGTVATAALLAILSTVGTLAEACGGDHTGDGDSTDADGPDGDVVDGPPPEGEADDGDDGDDGDDEGAGSWVWPNDESGANSDPWIAEHHAGIVEMHPRVLALNFVNAKTNDRMIEQMDEAIAAIEEASRYHGYADADAPAFLRYEIAYAIDLRDEVPPPDWPYRNSTLYPREDPPTGTWGLDYGRLLTPEFAGLMGIEDPDEPGRVLDLCELIDRGLVHEVWIFGDGDVPDVGAAEILEMKPYYDDDRRRVDRRMNPCAGNGCFDADDPVPEHCGRTIRIAWFNTTRGPGCFLESLSHGFESIAAWNRQIPYLRRYFVPFAAYALDTRYGLPVDSWYACPYDADCLTYPTETSVAWTIPPDSGTIDPWDPVCGNVHFPPNARGQYDLRSPFTVLTTCRGYRLGEGPGGADEARPFTSSLFSGYRRLAPDCMGPFLVWWRQNFPGLGNAALDDDAAPMLNWWPFLFY